MESEQNRLKYTVLKNKLIEEMKELRFFGAIDLEENAFVLGNTFTPEDAILIKDAKIVFESEEKVVLEETDVYNDRYTVKVKRPKEIRARVIMEDGETTTVRYSGLTARFFQQMMDQLNGVSSRDRANRYHRDLADRKRRKNVKI